MLLLTVVNQSVVSLMIRGKVQMFDTAQQSITFDTTKVLRCSAIQLLLTYPPREVLGVHIQYNNPK
jgi:hypothetical protein